MMLSDGIFSKPAEPRGLTASALHAIYKLRHAEK